MSYDNSINCDCDLNLYNCHHFFFPLISANVPHCFCTAWVFCLACGCPRLLQTASCRKVIVVGLNYFPGTNLVKKWDSCLFWSELPGNQLGGNRRCPESHNHTPYAWQLVYIIFVCLFQDKNNKDEVCIYPVWISFFITILVKSISSLYMGGCRLKWKQYLHQTAQLSYL